MANVVWDAREYGGLLAIFGLVILVFIDILDVGIVDPFHYYIFTALITALLGVDMLVMFKKNKALKATFAALSAGIDTYNEEKKDIEEYKK